ncbi:hypothetical protein BTA51_01605 [Hahella sp. CCB-MM4]|uniref:putative signal transducing protein n=1 Tax=Hahella sp. (strain CCB-MM4) TaxID=1926491 RepID=UPI000B9BBE46|nr:DUF2007 domain-containing protein [Hahella sp. CCB-MM4]OZG75112.1 hypothetical protein BTA51_01605 [Hahella sp. CCB-MM4]
MRHVFEASNMLEAHVVNGMLQAEGINSFVQGDYLQGGIGDLPVSGLVRIAVNDVDYEQARAIIQQWEREQQDAVVLPSRTQDKPWVYPFVLGFGLGILVALWFL